LEDECQSYRHAVVRALQEHRPHAKVAIAALDKLEAEVKRLDPQLVIFCGRPDLAEALGDEVPSWVRLSQHPEWQWRIRVGERRWELLNPTPEELVSVPHPADLFDTEWSAQRIAVVRSFRV